MLESGRCPGVGGMATVAAARNRDMAPRDTGGVDPIVAVGAGALGLQVVNFADWKPRRRQPGKLCTVKRQSRGLMATLPRKLQVLLIDDEGLLRDGLCALLNLEKEFVVAGAVSGTLALRTLVLSVIPELVIVEFGASTVQAPQLV